MRGSILIETTIAMLALTVLSLVMFKATLNILQPRQWSIVQQLTDAYLTFEVALAERLPFEDLIDAGSPWPVYPLNNPVSVVVGTLPGGHQITGTVYRTREPDPNNGVTGIANLGQMETWVVQSHLEYRLAGADYVKSRTVIRTR